MILEPVQNFLDIVPDFIWDAVAILRREEDGSKACGRKISHRHISTEALTERFVAPVFRNEPPTTGGWVSDYR